VFVGGEWIDVGLEFFFDDDVHAIRLASSC
jgi:hypothetical protein